MKQMSLVEYVSCLEPTHRAAIELMQLRSMLYSAIVELQHVQDAEDHSQCASAKAKYIINRSMDMLHVYDLSKEHI